MSNDAWANALQGEVDRFGVDWAAELAARGNAAMGAVAWAVPAPLVGDQPQTAGAVSSVRVAVPANCPPGLYLIGATNALAGGLVLRAVVPLVVEAAPP